jgi:hypothetical protein
LGSQSFLIQLFFVLLKGIMSEIIPKEKILKNVRKGLVVPVQNSFQKLDLDSPIIKLLNPQDAIEKYIVDMAAYENVFFSACSNKFEFVLQLKALMEEQNWKNIICYDSFLTDLLDDNGLLVTVNDPNSETPLLSSCTDLNLSSKSCIFDHRYQDIRKILASNVLILLIRESQMKKEMNGQALGPMDNIIKTEVKTKELRNKLLYVFTIRD